MVNKPSFKNIPLVVDLDGTLIHTDLLYEGLVILVKKNPIYIFLCLLWLIKGKIYFKKEIYKRIQIPYNLLPLNNELVYYLKEELLDGRQLILATASLKLNAQEFAETIPIFHRIYGSEKVNLKGENKLNVLIDEFGEYNFDYIGNSHSDLTIFAKARYSFLVNPSRSLEKKARRISNLKHIWRFYKVTLKDYIKAIRVYQWIKNLLIFVPLVTSLSFTSTKLFFLATSGFLAFNFVASSGYIINDLLDLNSDRIHPSKKYRPFASGKITILTGLILAIILLLLGILIATQLNFLFSLILLIYLITSLSYSFYLKKIVLYDVFTLALLYSIRVIAGGLVTNIAISFWLIAFSTFLFLSLAFVKRYSELMKINEEKGLLVRGREYEKVDLGLLQIMGIVCGFISVVVFSLYLDSSDVRQLYSKPDTLWLIGFLILFWISRIWIITNRGKMTDDPIVFALKDINSYIIFLIIGLILWISI
ncbi:UbiA family prenyltransferase [Draconibacterium sp.]